MPFKFKLSKRLALIKASLVASAVLTLACDRSDLTAPQPPPHLQADAVTAVPVVSVVASANDGNIPQNTLDNNLATRWSANGDGQWIRYDFGAVMALRDRKSTRLNSSHTVISYAVFCLKKKTKSPRYRNSP